MTIDRDKARALIAEARNPQVHGNDSDHCGACAGACGAWPGDIVGDREDVIERLADALESALSAVPVEGEVEWGGKIVTASFEDGQERAPFCGIEDCECPDHEGPPLPAGTYVTIRLDEDRPVGLRRVTVREVAP